MSQKRSKTESVQNLVQTIKRLRKIFFDFIFCHFSNVLGTYQRTFDVFLKQLAAGCPKLREIKIGKYILHLCLIESLRGKTK